MVLINETVYNQIIGILSSFRGLSIECEEEVLKTFAYLPRDTIKSIISKHGQNQMKFYYHKFANRSEAILAE